MDKGYYHHQVGRMLARQRLTGSADLLEGLTFLSRTRGVLAAPGQIWQTCSLLADLASPFDNYAPWDRLEWSDTTVVHIARSMELPPAPNGGWLIQDYSVGQLLELSLHHPLCVDWTDKGEHQFDLIRAVIMQKSWPELRQLIKALPLSERTVNRSMLYAAQKGIADVANGLLEVGGDLDKAILDEELRQEFIYPLSCSSGNHHYLFEWLSAQLGVAHLNCVNKQTMLASSHCQIAI